VPLWWCININGVHVVRIDSLMDKKSKTSKGFTVDNYLYINLITNYSYGIAYRVGGH
jgi:hypothetical protein